MPYIDVGLPHAGSAEMLMSGLYDELAGTVARTLPRGQLSSANLAALTTTGQVAVRGLPLPAGLVVTNIAVLIGGTGATGATNLWFGITDISLNVLAVTTDRGAVAQTNSTLITMPVIVPYAIPYTGLFYIAVSSTASTTAPTLGGINSTTGAANLMPPLFGTAGTQATAPIVGTQLAGGTVTGLPAGNFAAWIT
ncbi:MAG: hypothetical protein JWO67_2246 [Streptosporangiaceae bacterium]|nr:hypothetical protein [Streptosporangiaceae bacterium]